MTRFKIILKGEVIPIVRIEPDGAVMFFGTAGAHFEKRLKICPGIPKPLVIKKVENSLPKMVDYELKKTERGCYTLTVRNKLQGPGSYKGRIEFHTGYEEQKVFEVRVQSLIMPKVQVYPARILMGKLSRTGPKTSRWVTVSSALGGSIHIKEITYNRELFEVRVDESEAQKGRLKLSVILDSTSLPPGRFQEPLILSFVERELDPVKVTVTGLVED